MGAWSTRIFDNDLSMDIITEYRTLLGYGITPDTVYDKITGRYAKDYIGKDDEDDYWLAIAYFQWKNGILKDDVKENAIRCIDDGKYLDRWEESGKKVYEKRKKVLEEFRYNLINIQNPEKKKFPKCPAYLRLKTPFRIGDIILYRLLKPLTGSGTEDYNVSRDYSEKVCGKYFLLKVVDIEKNPVSDLCPELDYTSYAVLMLYDWVGDSKPDMETINKIPFKKFCKDVRWVQYDFETMTEIENPYYVKKMRSTYRLENIKYLGIGDICEIEVIGNDESTNIDKIQLWQECPDTIVLDPGFDLVLMRSFAELNYKEI